MSESMIFFPSLGLNGKMVTGMQQTEETKNVYQEGSLGKFPKN